MPMPSLPKMTLDAPVFDYSVWSPGTVLTLSNVPWDANYRDLVRFKSQNDCIKYVKSRGTTVTINNATYCAQSRPFRVNIPFSKANKFNYIIAENPAMPIRQDNSPTVFFYFISHVEYVAPNTTELIIQLDVWQTYAYNIKFGKCYIERGHIGIAASNANSERGRRFLSVPEGIDTGDQYVSGPSRKKNLNFNTVLVTSTVRLDSDPGDASNPKIRSANGSLAESLPNGCEVYIVTKRGFVTFLQKMTDKPWITQGIQSVTLIPEGSEPDSNPPSDVMRIVDSDKRNSTLYKDFPLLNNFRGLIQRAIDSLGHGRYGHLGKFLTAPYSVIEITCFNGSSLTVNPESVNSDNLELRQWSHVVPPSPRICWTVKELNVGPSDTHSDPVSEGDFLGKALIYANFPMFSVTNNSYFNYLASNANSLHMQESSASWAQQKALTGAENARNINSRQIGAGLQQNALERKRGTAMTNLSNEYAIYGAVTSGAASVIGGVGGGAAGVLSGAASAAMGGINTALANSQRTESNAISNQFSEAGANLSASTASYVSDTNYNYAVHAAKGDYAQAIAGINAQVQDAKMIPPTTSGGSGGDAFLIASGITAIYARIKVPHAGAVRFIGEYWLRYGYALNCFFTPPENLMCMSRFTYWKMAETNIREGDCPEVYRQTIRGIFEKGVTVWANPDDIGNIDFAENRPMRNVGILE